MALQKLIFSYLCYAHTYWLYHCPALLLHALEYVTAINEAIFLVKAMWKSGFECKTVSFELMTSNALFKSKNEILTNDIHMSWIY